MRRLLIASAVFAAFAAVGAADEIWLKDGRTLTTTKPVVTKGKNALVTTTDGVLVSVPLSEIDQDKTAEARRKAAAAVPAPTPNLMKPLTPAEAARVKSNRKAVVTLTDDTVAHGFGDAPADTKEGDGAGKVDVSNTSATRTKDGYTFSGSVLNSGSTPVTGVSVTIEVVGKDGKTFSSAYAQVTKDNLGPGEKTTFSAAATLDGDAASFKYIPRWDVPLTATKTGTDSAAAPGAAAAGGKAAAAEGEPTPVPTPPPAPTLVPIPRPDIAPPSANPPVGNPASGAFLPPPDAPRTTGKPPST
jgi:hypothetical protein